MSTDSRYTKKRHALKNDSKKIFSVFPDDEFILKQKKKNSITFKSKKKSSDSLSLLGPQLHLTTLQGIMMTSKLLSC